MAAHTQLPKCPPGAAYMPQGPPRAASRPRCDATRHVTSHGAVRARHAAPRRAAPRRAASRRAATRRAATRCRTAWRSLARASRRDLASAPSRDSLRLCAAGSDRPSAAPRDAERRGAPGPAAPGRVGAPVLSQALPVLLSSSTEARGRTPRGAPPEPAACRAKRQRPGFSPPSKRHRKPPNRVASPVLSARSSREPSSHSRRPPVARGTPRS